MKKVFSPLSIVLQFSLFYFSISTAQQVEKEELKTSELLNEDRLFVLSTAVPLEKGEWQYQNSLVLGNRIRGGVTKNISASLGLELGSLLNSISRTDYRLSWVVGIHAGFPVSERLNLGVEFQGLTLEGDPFVPIFSLLASYSGPSYQLTLRYTGIRNAEMFGEEGWPAQGPSVGFRYRFNTRWSAMAELNFILGRKSPDGGTQTFFREYQEGVGVGILGPSYSRGRHCWELGIGLIYFYEMTINKSFDTGEVLRRNNSSIFAISPIPLLSYIFQIKE